MNRNESVVSLLSSGEFIYVAAPMVRYSKLAFRLLCRRWGCDIVYTPMIVSEDFVASQHARNVEFSTHFLDRPLITQFAARNPTTLAKAAQLVAKHCDGIDINCGCPQAWAIKEGYGCALLNKPEDVKEMIRQAKEASNLPVSIKIRISQDMSETIELAKRAEKIGAAWITVHGRTPQQRSYSPVSYSSVKMVKESVQIPIIANGHCYNLKDAERWRERSGVNGVMAARGLLQNPALFKGYDHTPKEVVCEWLDIALALGVPQHKIHQHLMFMLFDVHTPNEKEEFNALSPLPAIIDFLKMRDYPIGETTIDWPEYQMKL